MEFKLTSVRKVVYTIIRDLGLGDKEIAWQDIVEYCMEALQQIDSYTQYKEVIGEPIEVENHMAKLPEDFYTAMSNPNLEYKIQGDSIVVSKKNGIIKLNYLAFILDEEGFLMIPDDISYSEALLWKVATKLCRRGELSGIYSDIKYCEAKWNFYCTQARAKGNSLGADGIERFARQRMSLGRNTNAYPNEFSKWDGLKDLRK